MIEAMLGAGRYVVPGVLLFGSVSYDDTSATLFRLGFTIRWR
ncbi:MAG TPA: hypothetical protein VHM67_00605 [Gemmatimonadaceae bacterium]|nr:hypothetical protein [Gemmatimonadaceae bacterium]